MEVVLAKDHLSLQSIDLTLPSSLIVQLFPFAHLHAIIGIWNIRSRLAS
jgi:hypothetical protein